MTTEITLEKVQKCLAIIDQGLVKGKGNPKPGQLCVEAAICLGLGLPHSDDPECVSRALRSFKITLNDSNWSSNEARAKGLRRLGLAQLGSRNVLDDAEFIRHVTDLAIRKWTPSALRSAASCHPNPTHQKALLEAALRCEAEGTKDAARSATRAAYAASAAANAASAAASAAAYSASAAAYAADYSARSATRAAYAAAYAADYSASSATRATRAAYSASAAAYSANAASAAADAAAYSANAASAAADAANAARAAANAADAKLAEFAEDVVQILIEMNAPGCQWLPLTEAA